MSRNEGEIRPQGHTPNQTFTTDISITWRRLQHRAPPTHDISKRGRCRGDLQAQFYDVEAAVGSTLCDILQVYVYFFYFLRNLHSTSDNSFYTSSFGHADHAISIVSTW